MRAPSGPVNSHARPTVCKGTSPGRVDVLDHGFRTVHRGQSATFALAQGTEDAQAVTLPPDLAKTTAVLTVPNANAPSGETRVYLLAMSHVSAASCEDVRTLVRTVQPDVVAVELCKDRLGLLATEELPGQRAWHSASIKITGVPDATGFPSPEALQTLLTCKPGRPVSTDDIEGDVVRLESTGLFRTVRPGASSGRNDDAPLFVLMEDEDKDVDVHTVPPFACIEFRCEPRPMPPIKSFSCRVDSAASALKSVFTKDALKQIEEAAMTDANAEDSKTLNVLMSVRGRIQEAAAAAEEPAAGVVFSGVENGDVEAVIVLDRGAAVTGLEKTAVNGEGFGIEPFRNPNREGDVRVGLTSALTADAIERMAKARQVAVRQAVVEGDEEAEALLTPVANRPGKAVRAALKRSLGRTQWREWTWKEKATVADEDPEPQPLKDLLADTLTGWYGRFQGAAGQTVGIEGGEAWRVAFAEAAQSGASQVILVDRPAAVTQRRLAQGVWDALAPRVGAGLLALNAAVFAGALGALDPTLAYEGVGASLAFVLLAAVVPVALPLAEVWRFSRMSAAEVEAAVRVPEDITADLDKPLKLYGEDALLDWPGASKSIIAERDDYMARALAAAAQGRDGQVPAFVVDEVDGYPVMRYMMADGASNKAAPTGRGDGAYQPLGDASVVVAVLGSAHVRGICQRWETASQDLRVEPYLDS